MTRRTTRRALATTALAVLGTLLACGCGEGGERPLLASTAPPNVRVLLQRREKRHVLRISGQVWEMVAAEGRPFIRRARTQVETPLRAGTRGIVLGTEDTGATVLRVQPEHSFELNGTRYPGTLILHLVDGAIRCVNETDLETYVAGVIPNEMAPGALPAAYRAQAVAARTYAWIKLQDPASRNRIFEVFDDQSSQVYTGLDPRYDVGYPDMVGFTANTAGVILTWRNQPFPAYYSSTCGGHTTDPRTSALDPAGASEPLRGVKCDFCRSSRKYAWTETVADAALLEGLERRRRPVTPPLHRIEVTRRGAGGWAAEITIVYGPNRKAKTLPGTEFRSAARLDSHHILGIRRQGRGWEIEGRGWGHGVGLCQWGGMEMARRGFSESEILSWYYPGASFTRVY